MKELNRYGTFSNVCSVILSIEKVLNNEEEPFYVNWPLSDGRDWDKVFENPYKLKSSKKSVPFYIRGRLIPVDKKGILKMPIDREFYSEIIKKYIRLKDNIKERIQKEIDKFPKDSHTLGVHIRGIGRFGDDGTGYFKYAFKSKEDLPIDEYIIQIKRHMKHNTMIYLSTDTQVPIKYLEKEFPGRIIYQDCHRASRPWGEIHHHREMYMVDNQTLFEEVVIDAYVMSMMDFVILTNSNISNFILAKEPSLEYYYIFEPIEKKIEKCYGKSELNTNIFIY